MIAKMSPAISKYLIGKFPINIKRPKQIQRKVNVFLGWVQLSKFFSF